MVVVLIALGFVVGFIIGFNVTIFLCMLTIGGRVNHLGDKIQSKSKLESSID